MITRDLAGSFYVQAFNEKTFGSSAQEIGAGFPNCTASGYNPTDNGFNGRIIDRLGLPGQFNSVLVIARGQFSPDMSSTGVLGAQGLHANYVGLSVGLDHNCSTGAGWTAYATGQWSDRTAAYMYCCCSTHQGFLTTATSTSDGLQNSTSTGPGVVTVSQAFDLSGAKRFVRMVVTPTIFATDCAVHNGVTVTGSLLFGGAVERPANPNKQGRIHVTSACSTST
ncbi:MAG: hypothetical protein RLZZ200_2702 [Pseudomonadota bacterium]|jgi:hypothetical protein